MLPFLLVGDFYPTNLLTIYYKRGKIKLSDFKESEHPRDTDGKFTVKGKSNNRFIQWIKNQRKRLKEKLSENLNKPITKITDEAIEKTKTHQIDGYTQEQCKYIAEQHKELLRYARDNNDNKEVAFVFRQGLKEKEILLGTDIEIPFPPNIQNMGKSLFVMHNHPRNSSYSIYDINEFVKNNSIKTLSIAKNNGEIEILTKTKKYDSIKMYVFIGRLKNEIQKGKNQADTIRKILNKAMREGMLIWSK